MLTAKGRLGVSHRCRRQITLDEMGQHPQQASLSCTNSKAVLSKELKTSHKEHLSSTMILNL